MTMEPPTTFVGPDASKGIRDAKVNVLNAIEPIRLEDVVLGQYEGYADDPTIDNKDTNTPTFATIRLFINTPRWHGVPFIMKAGKALNERKAEMRVQFKDAPGADYLFKGEAIPRNELGKSTFSDLLLQANSAQTHRNLADLCFCQSWSCSRTSQFI